MKDYSLWSCYVAKTCDLSEEFAVFSYWKQMTDNRGPAVFSSFLSRHWL